MKIYMDVPTKIYTVIVTVLSIFALVLIYCCCRDLVYAQSGSLVYIAPAAGTTVTNCGTPATGFPLCGVATGWFVWNGTAWVQLGTTPGVASITVCNAAGASCGTAVTGAVQLNVPKTVTVTGSLQ